MSLPRLNPWLAATLMVAMAAWLSACGGGGSTTAGNGVGSGGTGSFTTGSVSGFGSVIVNSIRYDYTDDKVSSLDGDSRTALALGMVVDVEGSDTTVTAAGTVAVASQIRVGYELLGPVSAVNTTAGTVSVLGQQVFTSVDTFYDQASNLAGLGLGNCGYARVYGFPRSAGGYTATRIECLSTAPTSYRIRGRVTRVVTASGVTTVDLGNTSFTLAGYVPRPVVDQVVRARVGTTGPSWIITALQPEARPLTLRREGRVEGLVTQYNASTRRFDVNGVPVQLSNSTQVQLSNGQAFGQDPLRVEVEGLFVDGILQASRVIGEDDRYLPGGMHQDLGDRTIELRGLVTQLASNKSSFMVKGVRVIVDGNTVYASGSASQLSENQSVEVQGVRMGGGTMILARLIKFSTE